MRFSQLVLGAVTAALALPAAATVVVYPSLEELTHRSEVVIQAVVRDVVSMKDERGRLITETTLEVTDGLSGQKAGDIVRVQQLGGKVGDQQAWIAGAHRFTQNEEVIFFGVRLPKDPTIIVPYGIGFGIFAIEDDVDGRHVREITSGGVSQAVRRPDGTLEMKDITPRTYGSLDTFKAQLRSILEGENAAALPVKVMQRPQFKAPTLQPVKE